MTVTAAAWYLRAHDDGRPLGIFLRDEEPLAPQMDEVIETTDMNHTWRRARVVAFEQLAHACSMPRYTVTVEVLA